MLYFALASDLSRSTMRITRRLEFDSGHRIPDHQSQCRHLHGHRYAIEITLQGDIIRQAGSPLNGMVMDVVVYTVMSAVAGGVIGWLLGMGKKA